MKLATLLIVLLSNQGYWISGQEGTINIRPAARGGLPAADFFWDLTFDGVKISGGTAALAQGDNPTTIRIKSPPCRQRILLHLRYRVLPRGLAQELTHGDLPIQLFPDDIASELANRIGKKRLYIWDAANGIPSLLDREKVSYARVDSESQLEFASADVVLVGRDRVDDSLFAQAPLMALAEGGASVMLFCQNRPERLMGYDLSKRDAPARFDWRADHPLLKDFEPDDLQSLAEGPATFSSVRLSENDPALELAYYPPEIPGVSSGPIDAVLMTKSVGAGRFVICQLDLDNWVDDPRSQMFLRNAIDYLLTSPRPTPSRANRPEVRPAPTPWVPTIPVDPGGEP